MSELFRTFKNFLELVRTSTRHITLLTKAYFSKLTRKKFHFKKLSNQF